MRTRIELPPTATPVTAGPLPDDLPVDLPVDIPADLPVDLPVEIPAVTLRQLGFRRVVASSRASARDVHALIAELHATRSDHTWRSFSPRDGDRIVEELLDFENQRRATRVFYYHGVTDRGARELVATGAVSPELRAHVAPPGFAVVSRCYILQQFRGARLYAPLLRHRVEHAQALLGDRLRGIHFGSANPRVFHAIQHAGLPVRFVYLGRERITCGGERITVHDFLGPTERFRTDLLRPPRSAGASAVDAATAAEIHAMLRALCSGGFGPGGYRRCRRLVEATDLAAVFRGETCAAIRSLLAVMASIPILDDDDAAAPSALAMATEPDGDSDV